jgi:hypothetical protein
MNRLLKLIPIFALILMFVAVPALAAGESAGSLISKGLTNTGSVAGYAGTEQSLPVLIGKVIQALLGVVGVLFLVLTVYAGIMYMTAGGDPGKVEKGKKIIINSLIGLIIIIGAYAFTSFVVNELKTASNSGQPAAPAAG